MYLGVIPKKLMQGLRVLRPVKEEHRWARLNANWGLKRISLFTSDDISKYLIKTKPPAKSILNAWAHATRQVLFQDLPAVERSPTKPAPWNAMKRVLMPKECDF